MTNSEESRMRYCTYERTLGNERGMALVMALILGVIGMLMLASVLYVVRTGAWTSGSKKRYQEALASAHGGMSFFAKEIIQRGVSGTALSDMGTYNGMLTQVITSTDFTKKLTTTGIRGDGTYPNGAVDMNLTLTFPAPNPNMVVGTTILSTSRGNSGTSSNVLVGGGVVNNAGGTIAPQHIPYLFQIDIQARSAINTRENAWLSTVYAY